MPAPALTIKFGSSVAGDAVDRLIADARSQLNDRSETYIFDLSEVTFIHIAACQSLIAYWSWCKSKAIRIWIRLPRSRKVRDFWRVWRYPQAVKDVLSIEFDKLVHPEDVWMLKEVQQTYNEKLLVKSFSSTASRARREENFLSFHTLSAKFSDTLSANAPLENTQAETDLWKQAEIRSALSKFLGGDGAFLPSRVIFEAIFNGFRHPRADKLQVSAYHREFAPTLKNSAPDLSDRNLNLVFWDNGESILRTLDKAILSKNKIRTEYSDRHKIDYLVEFHPPKMASSVSGTKKLSPPLQTIGSGLLLDADTPEHIKLLASFFPGVTSKPYSLNASDTDVTKYDPDFGGRGMGLYSLSLAVTSVMNGVLFVRTDKYFMSMKKITKQQAVDHLTNAKLYVEIFQESDYLNPFVGNMLRVEIMDRKQP